MNINLFFIIILSHIIFDFVLQNNFILEMRFPKPKSHLISKPTKKSFLHIKEGFYKLNVIKISTLGNLTHSLMHLIGIYIITTITGFISGHAIYIPLSQVLLISFFHFIIDELKSLLYLKNNNLTKNIWIFFLDQLLHLIVIIFIFSICNNIDLIYAIRSKLLIYPRGFSLTEKLLIVSIIVFTSTWCVGIFIKILMSHLSLNTSKINLKKHIFNEINPVINKNNCEEDLGAPNGGFTIGLLERIFILLSIIFNYPMMIGFVLTVKSVARFKKLSSDSFAEYFIIGTFLSFIPGILGGILIKSLFS